MSEPDTPRLIRRPRPPGLTSPAPTYHAPQPHRGALTGSRRRQHQDRLHHTEDAEDALQATFLMLARKAGAISRRESVSGWLYTVAYRIALRIKRRSAQRIHRQMPVEDMLDDESGSDPAERMAYRELRRLLDAELSRMPEKYRTAFILYHLEGKTCDEAAECLGCPRGTVRSRVGRARRRLRDRLVLRGWTAPRTPSGTDSQ